MTTERPASTAATSLTVWAVWMAGCVAAVGVCWFAAALSLFTLEGGQVTPNEIASARLYLNNAAVICAGSTVAVIVIAGLRSRKHRLTVPTWVAVGLALLSPWIPLYIALGVRIAGE